MGIAVEADQLKTIDFTNPVIMSQLKMIVPAGVEESRLLAFVRPFQPLVCPRLKPKSNLIKSKE